MSGNPEGGVTETMEVGGSRRLSLSPQGVMVEARGAGRAWVPARAIAYDEISAVYSYQARDWSFLGIATMLWLVLMVLLVIAALLQRWGLPYIGFGALAVTLVCGALAAYRIARVPRRLLKIDALGGDLTVPNRSDGFFHTLAARLPTPLPPAPAAASLSGAPPAGAPVVTAPAPAPPSYVSPGPPLEPPSEGNSSAP